MQAVHAGRAQRHWRVPVGGHYIRASAPGAVHADGMDVAPVPAFKSLAGGKLAPARGKYVRGPLGSLPRMDHRLLSQAPEQEP